MLSLGREQINLADKCIERHSTEQIKSRIEFPNCSSSLVGIHTSVDGWNALAGTLDKSGPVAIPSMNSLLLGGCALLKSKHYLYPQENTSCERYEGFFYLCELSFLLLHIMLDIPLPSRPVTLIYTRITKLHEN